MTKLFATLVGILMFAIPVMIIIFLARWILKKPKKKLGITILISVMCFVVFTICGVMTDPATWCDHKYEIIKEIPSTYNKKGEIIKKCSLCEHEKIEHIDKKPHQIETVDKTPASEEPDETIKITENSTDKNTETSVLSQNKEPQENKSDYYTDNKVEGNLPEIDNSVVKNLVDAGYTMEHATTIQKILLVVGITQIEIYHQTGEAEKGLNAMSCYANGSKEDISRFTLSTEDGITFYVGYLNEDLYDVDLGGFLKKYTDVHVPETHITWDIFYELQDLAVVEVKKHLNYSNTAYFNDLSWVVGRSDNKYKIIGTLTAENGFGVKKEINFSVWFVDKDDKFIVEGVTLNGVRVK